MLSTSCSDNLRSEMLASAFMIQSPLTHTGVLEDHLWANGISMYFHVCTAPGNISDLQERASKGDKMTVHCGQDEIVAETNQI